ncbi:toluene tolerance protein [Pseudomonas sp. NY15364]|uniref:toluene tolerance protein n=1 Tax=Pseudomonas sp. NY15364 TaxID=3400353 RepID=UPI003A88CB82
MLTFIHLPTIRLNEITEAANILEQDSFGPKVYELSNGNMLKLFRRKRLFSSALLRPQSLRFCANAASLHQRGIPTLTPLKLYQLDDPAWTAVLYQPLQGKTLSQIVKNNSAAWPDLLPELAQFINHLHETGIYFRSLHLGNIVLTPDNTLGLIDIADLHVRRGPLSPGRIRRNQEHFDKYLRKENLPIDSTDLWTQCKLLRKAF